MEPFLGEIMSFAGTVAPAGWTQCHGQVMRISENTALFTILGTMYGGDGRETFALPDLRGRVPIGAGEYPGAANIELGQTVGSPAVQAGSPIYGPPVVGLNWCIAVRGNYPSRA